MLSIDDEVNLGQGCSYSGETFYYLQKVLGQKTGKSSEVLAKEHVFVTLGMDRLTFAFPIFEIFLLRHSTGYDLAQGTHQLSILCMFCISLGNAILTQ